MTRIVKLGDKWIVRIFDYHNHTKPLHYNMWDTEEEAKSDADRANKRLDKYYGKIIKEKTDGRD